MVKDTDEVNFFGRFFSRYSLSLKILWHETGVILKNVYLSSETIYPHPLRYGPFAVSKYSFMARRLAAAATSTRLS
jgi:hypothetical protein